MSSVGSLLTEMFRSHHRDLIRLATRLVGSRDDAEEVAQETYLKIAGCSSPSGTILSPRGYLFAAARNVAVDFVVRRNRDWSSRAIAADVDRIASDDDLDLDLDRKRQLARLLVALNDLPTTCRQVFLMNKVDGYSHIEIASCLDISVSMVEKHVMRALRHSRDLRRE